MLASFVRWWERVRRPHVRMRRGRQKRNYDWARRGRTAQAAVWRQALFDEAAAGEGLGSATILVDLEKAFERVRLADAWTEGLRLGFPPVLLRATLEIFAFARVLTMGGARAEAVHTLTAILAGSSFATDVLYLVMIGPVDELVRKMPTVVPSLYVDDLSLHTLGEEGSLVADVTEAARHIVKELEENRGMKVSRGEPWKAGGKTVVTTSSKAAASALKGAMKAVGIHVVKRATNLGVDYGAGKKVKNKALKDRWGRRAHARVAKTAFVPAMRYGVAVRAPTDEMIAKIQRITTEAYGSRSGSGGSRTARLEATSFDPGADMAVEPIKEWAMLLWNESGDQRAAASAWKHATTVIAQAARPASAAVGPAGACYAALKRLKWKFPAAHAFLTHEQEIVDLRKTPPMVITKMARRRFRDLQCGASTVADDLRRISASSRETTRSSPSASAHTSTSASSSTSSSTTIATTAPSAATTATRSALASSRMTMATRAAPSPPSFTSGQRTESQAQTREELVVPFFEPLAAAVRAKSKGGEPNAVAMSLIALAEGRWLTQADLARMGLSESNACAACRSAIGDLPHRILECTQSDTIRAGWGDDGRLTHAIDRKIDPLYVRGVAVRPHLPPPPELHIKYECAEGGHDTPFHSYVFLDGAMRHNATPLARRGGWAAVMTDRRGNMRRTVYGTSPDRFPTIFLSELRAAVMALKEVVGPTILFSDNAQVVSEWQRGEKYCTDGMRQGADLWRQRWHSVNELDGAVRIVKVKAHLTARDVETGRIPAAVWRGNNHADDYAKKGAAWAEQLSPVKHILEAQEEAK